MIWACTSTVTWLLLLASQTYTQVVSAATAERHPRMSQIEPTFSPEQTQCIHSLLSDQYRIPPTAFTATSDLGESGGARRYTAENLRSEKTERAWCPNRRVGTELTEFVQVDMGEMNAITKMVISGLHAEEGVSLTRVCQSTINLLSSCACLAAPVCLLTKAVSFIPISAYYFRHILFYSTKKFQGIQLHRFA
ncbi:unnamed protein product [Echinostoma caproni]|uniref:F5/8 type C domain-containing protein n=1 Tax=Echinostoma caproni TaxID=27848 RepID=A0A3P8BJJ2_9TREM|nr:unnamed protein product [Echinostoma caproni]